MPTPFYHLSVAEDLLAHPDLPGRIRSSLERELGPFLFGHTAPDVQVVSGQTREATHFFDLPLRVGDRPPWERMLEVHPSLARPEALSPGQAAFLAGYLCHLLADWEWIRQIFVPVFGPEAGWASFYHRLYLHNVLRAYLDRDILDGLSNSAAAGFTGASPAGWLPFVQDRYLAAWRDYIAVQMQPGAAVQTVEVFAARQGLAPEAFHRLISSEEEMEREIFTRLPRRNLDDYRRKLVEESAELVARYLARSNVS